MNADLQAIAAFLLARIAEDEETAQAATEGPWRINRESDGQPGCDPYLTVVATDEGVLDAGGEYCGDLWLAADEADLTHIVRWDPARVLAECEAKRRIVEKYRETLAAQEAKTDEHTRASSRVDRHGELPLLRRDGWVYEGRLWGLRVALTFLALPYADHPDYDPAWRP